MREERGGRTALWCALTDQKESAMEKFPSFDLSGRVALVTGAARGLGSSISLALANAGADIALGLRDVKTGGELARAIEKMGRRVLPLQMDVTPLDQVTSAI